jgi:hypothetical protein
MTRYFIYTWSLLALLRVINNEPLEGIVSALLAIVFALIYVADSIKETKEY